MAENEWILTLHPAEGGADEVVASAAFTSGKSPETLEHLKIELADAKSGSVLMIVAWGSTQLKTSFEVG